MASKFWVGGTGSWSDTAHWATSSGGAGSTGIPATGDTVTFDANSGGGTVTADVVTGLSLASITCGAFTGTIDFAAGGNPSLTLTTQFSLTGTGVRTITMGSGTFTLTATNNNAWDAGTTTNLTFSGASATYVISSPGNANTQSFNGGGLTYGTVSLGSRTNNSTVSFLGSNTFANFSITAPVRVAFAVGSTTTISNAITWAGTSSNPIAVSSSSTGATLALAGSSTIAWAAINGLTFTGSPTATNSFDLKANSGITISAPSTGGARVIGG